MITTCPFPRQKWKVITSFDFTGDPKLFSDAGQVLLKKPDLLNSKVGACKLLLTNFTLDALELFINKLKSRILNFNHGAMSVEAFVSTVEETVQEVKSEDDAKTWIQILIPKNGAWRPDITQVFIQRSQEMTVWKPFGGDFKPRLSPDIPFKLTLAKDKVELCVPEDSTANSHVEWLSNTLIPKFKKWMSFRKGNTIESLRLMSVDLYFQLYNKLKDKYGPQICNMWTEVTDPQKFVYEDIAIATYLLLLWKGQRKHFVDLGCGNGLLVFILNGEGHQGLGVDVRPRKIWKVYPGSPDLQVATLDPQTVQYPDADWILGNHSDELTPWIPIVTAKSSYHCNFFLLPCCPYNLDGSKFQRTNSSTSQFQNYLDYIQQLCAQCGFQIDTDRLRIPSTKRICFTSRRRVYDESEWTRCISRLERELQSQIKHIKLKPSVETVRNCSQLDKGLVDRIIKIIAVDCLLKSVSRHSSSWDQGDKIHLTDLAQRLNQTQPLLLTQLKKEHGGLQTLLRNHGHIFQIIKGEVSLRKPSPKSKNSAPKWKEKPCWFFNNHPLSCPLPEHLCSFRH